MGCLFASAHWENQIHSNSSSPSCLKELAQTVQKRTLQQLAGINLKCIV